MSNNIKIVIFDLDGVLVDAKEIHFESLNRALKDVDEKFVISREEHLITYDGLPTKDKLKILTEKKGLSEDKYSFIWNRKQSYTIDVIRDVIPYDHQKVDMMKRLKEDGYEIYVASNSIRMSLQMMLHKTGIIEYVDYFFSNEDVKTAKPHPEIYLKCMIRSGYKPSECLIVEDSKHGRQAALESGANLCAVEYPEDVTYERIVKEINKTSGKTTSKKWDSDEFNILVPMAGAGSRFSKAGYTFPKPLIEVNNKPMIQVVVDNLGINAKFIYVVQKSHYEKYNLRYLLNLITPNCEIIQVEGVTEGAACTTLLAKEYIDNNKHLLIANSDQFMEWSANDFYYSAISNNSDGSIITFRSTHPKWSFVKLDENDNITEVAEKKPISDIATVGIYYWNKGSDYVKYAEQMIENNIRVNGEFYVAPVYNEAIKDGLKFKTFDISKMWGLGDPQGLNNFLENYKGLT
jgi:beta-phosphoglucomutase-like phosphatase (HAD superfamily)/dTDP-glucose pyrophosphorylase